MGPESWPYVNEGELAASHSAIIMRDYLELVLLSLTFYLYPHRTYNKPLLLLWKESMWLIIKYWKLFHLQQSSLGGYELPRPWMSN